MMAPVATMEPSAPSQPPGAAPRRLVLQDAVGLSRRALLLAGLLPLGAAQAADFERGLLWRVDQPGVAASHLFGTIHLDDARATRLAPAVRNALAGSRLLLQEMRADELSGRIFEAATLLGPGISLRQVAGDAVFERTAALLAADYGLPPGRTERLKPWAAYLALGQPPRRLSEIVDGVLHRLARAQGLAVAQLETVEAQIAALEAVPLDSQLALLDASSRHHEAALAAIDTLVERYLAEDLAGMLRLQAASTGGEPAASAALSDLLEHLLWGRNAAMVDRMLPALRQGGAFVAMGALHLHGGRGLPARLERRGWRVQRVSQGIPA